MNTLKKSAPGYMPGVNDKTLPEPIEFLSTGKS